MAAAERTEILEVPLERLFAVIVDFASYPKFVTGMKNVKILDPGRVEFDIEMMKRVVYTVKVEQSLDEAQGKGTVHWDLEKSDLLKANSGTWTLERVNPQSTKVNYRLDVEFKFPVPGFILKGLVANSLPTAIDEFSKETRKRGAAQ